jgi:hypothetical protein
VRESAIDDNDAIGTYLLNEYDLLDNYLSGLTAATNPLKKNTC